MPGLPPHTRIHHTTVSFQISTEDSVCPSKLDRQADSPEHVQVTTRKDPAKPTHSLGGKTSQLRQIGNHEPA